MSESNLIEWAERSAEQFLRQLGTRWVHVQQVTELAKCVGDAFGADRSTLVAAAMLHDVGYAPTLALTGFHPLDGARMVRKEGHEQVARLVAHHSGARHEARLRGISEYEDEFPYMDSDLDQALTYCDLTTGPDGSRMTLCMRVEEVTTRYGAEHVVARALHASRMDLERACAFTEDRMREAGLVISESLALPR